MAIIKARLAHSSDSQFFEFTVDWYGTPEEGNWYLNTVGFAQEYKPERPPSRFPCSERLILTPRHPREVAEALGRPRGKAA